MLKFRVLIVFTTRTRKFRKLQSNNFEKTNNFTKSSLPVYKRSRKNVYWTKEVKNIMTLKPLKCAFITFNCQLMKWWIPSYVRYCLQQLFKIMWIICQTFWITTLCTDFMGVHFKGGKSIVLRGTKHSFKGDKA